jgi:hypothetical protein
MAVLSTSAFISKWGTGKFPSDGARSITGAIMREFRQDIADSFVSVLGTTAISSWKDIPCIVSTTTNITLSGEQTIDGVLTSASRVLVKNQSDQEDNGIYVSDAGAWTRATDADSAAELEGAAVGVTQGTVGQNSIWLQISDAVTLGTTPLVWQQIGFGVSSQSLDEVLATGNDGGGAQIKNIADPTIAQDAATKAWVESQLLSAGVFKVKVSMTAAQIKAIYSTPFQLVAAPGANKITQTVFALYTQTYGTTAFDFPSGGQYGLYSGASRANTAVFSGSNMNQGSTFQRICGTYSPPFTGNYLISAGSIINTPITFQYDSGPTGDATLGDSTGEWVIYYRIIDLS